MLHTSQPTISRELARFEQLSGLVLFERRRGRLRPTAQALLLFEEVQRSYFGLERIVSTAQSIRLHEQGQLAIACLLSFPNRCCPPCANRFCNAIPMLASASRHRSRRCWKNGWQPNAMIWA
ncbi:LysR family transcriptional regulator [Paludibacterium denitrificans]|uniref:LysR family transcriptional regulator n=1 Tax=Paludibacterium denitrificans TaxID=2675226 RepID=UPI0024780C55|nr:LysR family transcriptional regulator [Paludibacterium denitrificans]